MKYVYLALNWVFGVLLGLIGLIALVESPLGGICLISISLLLLPPIRNAVYARTKKELPFKSRAISIFVLFIAFGIFAGQSIERKAAELSAQKAEEQAQKVAEARQKNIDYFNSHKDEIISSASSAISGKNYQLVMSQTSKYLPANDAELNEIYTQAKKALEKIKKAEKEAKEKLQREAKTKELVAKLKTVPASEFKENIDLYQQLVKLNPDNATYQKKFDYYSQMYEKAQLRDSFFGDFTKAKIEKKMGKATLQVWEPHIKYSKTLPPLMKEVMLSGVENLQVEYDEIWIITEKQLDRSTLYWKDNKIQASTLENYYLGDPSTGTKLSTPSYKVDNIYNRAYILKKLSEK